MKMESKCTLHGKNQSDECKEMVEIFKSYDKNHNGVIDKNELKNIVQAFDVQISDEELQVGLSIIDTNKDGKIEFEEFIKWWSNR